MIEFWYNFVLKGTLAETKYSNGVGVIPWKINPLTPIIANLYNATCIRTAAKIALAWMQKHKWHILLNINVSKFRRQGVKAWPKILLNHLGQHKNKIREQF